MAGYIIHFILFRSELERNPLCLLSPFNVPKSMSTFTTVSSLFVLSSLLTSVGHADIYSGFDADDEGWLVSGDATSATPDYMATGGNPGGFLQADDTVSGGTWYWDAPSKFLGDLSGFVGETLSFDLAQSATSSQFNNSDVILDGNGQSLHFNTSYNPGTTFTAYSLDLTNTGGWRLGSLTGSEPTAGEFADVLGDLTRLRIRGEYRSGPDTGSLDNVRITGLAVIPEPAAMPLAIGLLALVGGFRRRR